MTRQYPGGLGEPEYRGAEAFIYPVSWFGVEALAKVRVPKPYRHPELDARLRRSRTLTEARMLVEARGLGVPVPTLLYVDPDRALIIVERVRGPLLAELVEAEGVSERVTRVVERLGYYAGVLHENGVVHGDLSTSNVVVRGDTPYIIDFGLAEHSDSELDKAVDLHLFLRSLESTHPEAVGPLYAAFRRGYAGARGAEAAERVQALVERIRAMGRYVEEARRVALVWGGRG